MHHNLKNIHKVIRDIKTQLHKNPLVKFIAVFLIFVIYSIFSMFKFGASDGLLVGLMTWTFFVLCTPVADAGFILDLPIRVLTGIRMVYSEIIVWTIAIGSNLIVHFANPTIYERTGLLSLFQHIISHPWPFWIIIILSAGGTFLSLVFGDELMDISYEHKKEREHHKRHKHKYRMILIATLFIIILAVYDFLLRTLGVHIPLIG
ncbi:hypothetical protein JXA48_00740 [Candidatus Woesearchaeota archaeon]|nr:hypothetical protein [Candidatus Woesearchaeota archaeon]